MDRCMETCTMTQHISIIRIELEPLWALTNRPRRSWRRICMESYSLHPFNGQVPVLAGRHGAVTWNAVQDRHGRDPWLECEVGGVHGAGLRAVC